MGDTKRESNVSTTPRTESILPFRAADTIKHPNFRVDPVEQSRQQRGPELSRRPTPSLYQSCREKWPQQNEMPRMELQNPMESPAFHSFHKYLLNVYCVLGPMVCSPCPDTLLGSVPEGLTLGPMQTPQRGQRDANPKKTEVPPPALCKSTWGVPVRVSLPPQQHMI